MNESAVTVDLAEDILKENTQYKFTYQARAGNKVSAIREGSFKTFAKEPEKVSFIVSSCATTMSASDTFSHMA